MSIYKYIFLNLQFIIYNKNSKLKPQIKLKIQSSKLKVKVLFNKNWNLKT